MAQQTLPAHTRRKNVTFQLSESEIEIIDRAARAARRSKADWMRLALVDAAELSVKAAARNGRE
jgi:uncharacterized protein (DUF1778 family)